MASVSARALDQSAVEVHQGPYRVSSRTLTFETRDRIELHNLSKEIKDFVRASGVNNGQVVVASMHTTCAIFINEWQDALLFDIRNHLESLVSRDENYRHNDPEWSDCDRMNADSHLRTLVLGASIVLPVMDGEVVLGKWQSVILGELDGPRERTIHLQVMGAVDTKD